MDKTLHGKWALVTGSSRGIGQQIAMGLAQHGCNIILHAREIQHCSQTLQRLARFDICSFVVGAVLGNQEQEKAMVDAVIERTGQLDILYNNAAIMSPWHERLCQFSMHEWRQLFEINFFAPVRLCDAFYPGMQERQWGRIVNLVTGMQNTPQLVPYSAAKAALEKYTYELAVELKHSNVLVNALDPGWLKTDLGGPDADLAVETVLPGALEPVLQGDFAKTGQLFKAQDYRSA
jgi:NAD(P)-dependent dehydrogenase (short-subunit alcohol dehydrogenase family)